MLNDVISLRKAASTGRESSCQSRNGTNLRPNDIPSPRFVGPRNTKIFETRCRYNSTTFHVGGTRVRLNRWTDISLCEKKTNHVSNQSRGRLMKFCQSAAIIGFERACERLLNHDSLDRSVSLGEMGTLPSFPLR